MERHEKWCVMCSVELSSVSQSVSSDIEQSPAVCLRRWYRRELCSVINVLCLLLGPRLFLPCPMNTSESHSWFTDLWNFSIVPYLLEAVRDGVQVVVVVVVVMTSPSGTAYMGGQRGPEEMRNSTRLWIQRDPSLPRNSWQPFYWLGHHSRAAVVEHSWRTVDHCQMIDVDGRRQTVKLQSVLQLCSGFYRSRYVTWSQASRMRTTVN